MLRGQRSIDEQFNCEVMTKRLSVKTKHFVWLHRVKEDHVPLPVSERGDRIATDIIPQRDACVCLVGGTCVSSHPSAASNHRVIYNSALRPSRHICFREQKRATIVTASPRPSKSDGAADKIQEKLKFLIFHCFDQRVRAKNPTWTHASSQKCGG